jgi:hypothetical protein
MTHPISMAGLGTSDALLHTAKVWRPQMGGIPQRRCRADGAASSQPRPDPANVEPQTTSVGHFQSRM